MRPCDCRSKWDAKHYLNDQGLRFNEWSISLEPPCIILSNGTFQVRITQGMFAKIAEWYLEDQK